MKEIGEAPPVVIVQKVMLGESLPGIDDLCKHLKSRIAKAKTKTAEARVERINIIFDLFEYAAKEEVKLRIATINVDPATGKKKEGRPKQAHVLASEVIQKVCGISERTMRLWVADGMQIFTALNLIERDECENKRPTKTAREEFSAIIAENSNQLHDWFENLPVIENDTPPSDLTPDQIAKSIASVFSKHFYTNNGVKKLAPAARSAVMQSVNPVLKAIGFELLPIGNE